MENFVQFEFHKWSSCVVLVSVLKCRPNGEGGLGKRGEGVGGGEGGTKHVVHLAESFCITKQTDVPEFPMGASIGSASVWNIK